MTRQLLPNKVKILLVTLNEIIHKIAVVDFDVINVHKLFVFCLIVSLI